MNTKCRKICFRLSQSTCIESYFFTQFAYRNVLMVVDLFSVSRQIIVEHVAESVKEDDLLERYPEAINVLCLPHVKGLKGYDIMCEWCHALWL